MGDSNLERAATVFSIYRQTAHSADPLDVFVRRMCEREILDGLRTDFERVERRRHRTPGRLRWRMPKVIRWPDNSTTSGKTWDDVLASIGAVQWTPRSADMIRPVLARRAALWSGQPVSIGGTAEEFCHRLARAGMFEIVKDA